MRGAMGAWATGATRAARGAALCAGRWRRARRPADRDRGRGAGAGAVPGVRPVLGGPFCRGDTAPDGGLSAEGWTSRLLFYIVTHPKRVEAFGESSMIFITIIERRNRGDLVHDHDATHD